MMPLESRCEHRAAIHRGSSTASRCSSTIRVISRRSHLRPLTLMTHRSDFSLSQLSLFRLCVSIRSEPVSTRRDARFRVVLDALCRQQRLSHHSRGSARSISSALHALDAMAGCISLMGSCMWIVCTRSSCLVGRAWHVISVIIGVFECAPTLFVQKYAFWTDHESRMSIYFYFLDSRKRIRPEPRFTSICAIFFHEPPLTH